MLSVRKCCENWPISFLSKVNAVTSCVQAYRFGLALAQLRGSDVGVGAVRESAT
jgi:hypothetical protein